jgi:hypothetical protein
MNYDMIIDGGGSFGSFEPRTRQEATENVKALRDELKAKGKSAKQIQNDPVYKAARAELDRLVSKANIVTKGTAPVSGTGGTETGGGGDKQDTTGRTWTAPDGTIFNDETSYNRYLDTLSKINQFNSDAQIRAAEKVTEKRNAKEFLIASLKPYFSSSRDVNFLEQLTGIIDNYIKEDYDVDTIAVLLPQTEPYKQRFKGNTGRTAAGLSMYSPAEYLAAEETFDEILRTYNLGDLATRDIFASLIGGLVSADEARDRVINVYDRVRNADPILRAEIDKVEALGGGLTDADFAKALLTGSQGANELKRKISTLEITAEARQRNLSVNRAEELQQLGVTRAQARTGFEQIALTQPRLTQLSEIYTKTTPDAEGLQKELEQEQFQGMQSERRRRLAEQEQTSFMGQSGTASGISLARKRKGLI